MNIGYIDFDKALKTDGMEFKTTKGTWFRFLQAREKGIRYVSVWEQLGSMGPQEAALILK